MLLHQHFGGRGRDRSGSRRLRRSTRPALEGLERREVLSQVVTAGGVSYELAVNGDANEVLRSNGSSWTAITGANTSVSQIAAAGSGLFMLGNIGGFNQVWQYSGSGSNWSTITGTSTSVSQIAGAGNGLFMLDNTGGVNEVCEYSGSGTNWSAITGTNSSVSQIAGASSGVFMLGNNGGVNQVWKYSGSGTNWSAITGTNSSVSQIAAAGSGLFMLGNNGGANWVWEYSGSGSNWTPITGTSTQIVQVVSTGGALFMLGNNGGVNQVWEYSGSGTNWSAITGTNSSVIQISASSAELFMVADNRGGFMLWEYTGPGTNWTNLITDPTEAAGYSPAPSGAPLYNANGPSYLDVEQGATGDCWLLASLAEVAARQPQVIKNMFEYEGTAVVNGSTVGLYLVQLYSTNGTLFDVEVDTELPAGGGYDAHVANDLGTQTLWVALAEKAYAEANTLGLVSTHQEGQDSYYALNDEDAANALHAITGQPATDYDTDPANIAAAWNAGKLVVLGTTTPVSSDIVGSHVYALVGYNASASQPFTVFNPWGTDSSGWAPGYSGTKFGLFTATAAFISQNFAGYGVGSEAALGEDPTGPAIIVSGPTDHGLAKPEKAAVVQSSSSRSDATAVRSFRPAVVAATGSEGLGVLDAVTPGSGASWSSRRLSAKRFGSTMR